MVKLTHGNSLVNQTMVKKILSLNAKITAWPWMIRIQDDLRRNTDKYLTYLLLSQGLHLLCNGRMLFYKTNPIVESSHSKLLYMHQETLSLSTRISLLLSRTYRMTNILSKWASLMLTLSTRQFFVRNIV